MRKETLVESDIQDGERLIVELSKAAFPITGVFWYHFDESDEWRLVIESPLVGRKGPIAAYTWVESVLDHMAPHPGLQLSDISMRASVDDLLEMPRWSRPPRRGTRTPVVVSPETPGVMLRGAYIYNVQNIISKHDGSGSQWTEHLLVPLQAPPTVQIER